MTHRKQLLITTAVLALTPLVAHAAAISWTGTSSNAWETAGNWSTGAVPITTSAVTIANLTNNPVQLNSNVSLNATSGTNVGSLTVGKGAAPGTANVLNINNTYTLTMGSHAVTLAGGSITGLGTLSTTGGISGFGVVSSQISGTSFTGNATDGTAFGGFSPFVNGTPGTPLTLIGQGNLTSDTFAVSGHGTINFQGVTLTTPTLNGVSTNLNAGSIGGNNYYGLFTFSGAASTVVGNVNNTNYQQFDVNGTTLHLNNFSLTNSWATNVPPFFVINNGTVDNTTGNSKLNGVMATILNNGTISNTGGGTFSIAGQVNGTGTVSGPVTLTGGALANGGTLTIDGSTGAVTAASAGWGTAGGASDLLDLKGTINFSPALSFSAAPGLNPGGATVQLDSATINTTGGSGLIQTGKGQFTVATGTNNLNANLTPNGSTGGVPNFTIKSGATLNVNSPVSTTSAIWANNFSMEKGSQFSIAGANTSINVAGNFSYQQTDTINGWTNGGTKGLGPNLIMTGGTSASPTTLEVGSVNKGGYNPAAWVQNFALSSLTLGNGAYDKLVDNFANATSPSWTSGTEVLYLDGLFGVTPGSGHVIPTLNLMGLEAFLPTQSGSGGFLYNGLYTDPNGGEVNIIGASPAPEPAALLLFGSGLAGLALVRRRRRH
jgi:hypothetical protein